MSEELVRTAVNNYFNAICAMDVDAWVATFAEDGVSNDPVGAPPHIGAAALRAFFQGIGGAFQTIKMVPVEIFVCANEAAVKWTGQGTGKNGRAVSFDGIDLFTVNEAGKITSLRGYWNPGAVMMELQS